MKKIAKEVMSRLVGKQRKASVNLLILPSGEKFEAVMTLVNEDKIGYMSKTKIISKGVTQNITFTFDSVEPGSYKSTINIYHKKSLVSSYDEDWIAFP